MSEKNKAELEAEQADANAEARDDETTEATDGKTTEADEESKQLEAELKREREAREKAEKSSAEYAFKLREKQRKKEEQDEEVKVDESDDKPLTSKELQSILAKEREATRKEMLKSEADRIANSMSSNDMEKELILTIHKNRSFPENLSLQEQLEECFLLANKRKILGENSELKRALRGKQGASKDASSTHQDAPTGSQPKLAQGEAAEMARVGFKWNATARRYEKKLPNGQTLVRQKSGDTQVI